MKRRIPLEYAILGLAVAATAVIALPAHSQTVGGFAADKVARGKYLVSTSGCHDCHTPWKMGEKGPEPDMTRALSGHPETMALPPPPKADGPWIMSATATNTAWAGPWGISFTANLTPDPETGLGKWTQRNFTETIRTGRHMGRGREVLPPMPIPVYRNFTDADLESIFGYLQSLPAIRNRVPEPLPPTAAVAAKG
ncbi:MAG: diheme cytochrome c-553 [Burkholderiaceae bacterium]